MAKNIFMSTACRVLLLGMVLVLGTLVTGCPQTGDPTSDSSAKTVTITGLSGDGFPDLNKNEIYVHLFSDLESEPSEAVAIASGEIAGGSAGPLALRQWNDSPWTGSGSYYVVLALGDHGEDALLESNNKIAFNTASTTIAYSSGTFEDISD
jgi:hypothetical protein